jgi:hypothetical protein
MTIDATLRSRVLWAAAILAVAGALANYALRGSPPWGGWPLATATDLGIMALLALYLWRSRDSLVAHLVVFGIAAGLVELLADCMGVRLGDLVYPAAGPHIACSPLYMPLAWVAGVVPLAYCALWLKGRFAGWLAALLSGGLGALYIGLFEYLAKGAGEWYYRLQPQLFDTVPWAVIVAEFLIGLVLPALVARVETRPIGWATIGYGVLFGLWMAVAGALALVLVNAVSRA